MFKQNKIILLLIYIFLLSNYSFSQTREEEPKNILVMFTLNEGTMAYNLLLENFKNTLREKYSGQYKLFVEYLEVTKFPGLSYQQYLLDQYNKKYSNTKIDLLVCVGPQIIPILEKFAEPQITSAPTISLDLFNPYNDSIKYSLNPNTLEVLVNINVKRNFELAFSLFPNYKSVYIITGSAKIDLFFSKMVLDAAEEFRDSHKIIELVGLSMDSILNEASKISRESIIILPTITLDASNVSYTTMEATRLVSSKTSAPIFVLLDTPFDDGAFGGYVLSFKNVGIEAGNAAIKILNGESANSIRVNKSNLNQYVFDWRQLKRFKLENSSKIPPGSVIINQDFDFWDNNKWFIVSGISFLILQTILIVNLIKLNRKQKLITNQLIESENKYRNLVREDRILRMGELIASLSHELNQPLTAILNNAQAGALFVEGNKATPELLKEIFDNVIRDDKRAAEVISSVRGMMKLEKREKEIVNINDLINDVITIFRSEALKQKITLKIDLTDKPVHILGDQIQIQQVLLNFLFNSAIAMNENESKLIIISKIVDKDEVTISVRDFGPGINTEIMDKIFNPFVTSRKEGLGIGLAVCRSIIEDHQGKVWAENMVDGGAKFSFRLGIIENV